MINIVLVFSFEINLFIFVVFVVYVFVFNLKGVLLVNFIVLLILVIWNIKVIGLKNLVL